MTALSGEVRLAEALGAFSLASDFAFGVAFEDGVRSCYMAMRIAEQLGLPPEQQSDVYYTALLKDAGCTCWTSQLAGLWATDEIVARRELLIFGNPSNQRFFASWVWKHAGSDMPLPRKLLQVARVVRNHGRLMQEGFETACDVSVRLAARIGMSPGVLEALPNLFEAWDGTGMPRGKRGEEIPLAARIVFPTFYLAPAFSRNGREAVLNLARSGRGEAFDPHVADAFLRVCEDEHFWDTLSSDSLWNTVLEMEPSPAGAILDEAGLDGIAESIADYADLKAPHTAAHSRRVAKLTAALATRLRCSERETRHVRRVALMHDIGFVAVPSFTLGKPRHELSRAELENVRLHPYYGERILSPVAGMAAAAMAVGAHHENWNGSGYHRGTAGPDIPLEARIIAVADRYDILTHARPGGAALEPGSALSRLRAQPELYDPAALAALEAELGAPSRSADRKREWPAGLTDREVEVLRLAARGLTRKAMAKELVVSEHTVRHHLEHIYTKTGTATRVAATVFAMEHDLLP